MSIQFLLNLWISSFQRNCGTASVGERDKNSRDLEKQLFTREFRLSLAKRPVNPIAKT